METLKHLRGRSLWIVLGALVLAAVVLVILVRWVPGTGPAAGPQEGTTGQSSPAPAGKTLPKSYLDAVAYYDARGARFQFDAYCQAIPKQATFKNGTRVMLDNRSGDARNIKVGSDTYYLAGYGWRIIALYSSTLPKTLSMNCGSAVNVGTILLQR